jgi:DNA recombination protein Rad52
VRERQAEGRSLSYIEGWFAIAEANRIFGYGGWDRQMVHLERTFGFCREDHTNCGFLARVRINVRAEGTTIIREGTGFGSASATSASEAYDRAIKAAETDATKRALATFGNRFGLCLYDKEQRGVEDVLHPASAQAKSPNIFRLHSPDALLLAGCLSAEGFCSGLRQVIEACKKPEDIDALKSLNADELVKLRELHPNLCNRSGVHFADLLAGLMEKRQAKFLPDSIPIEPPALSSPLGQTEFVADNETGNGASQVANPAAIANGQVVSEVSDTHAAKDILEVLPASRVNRGPRVDKSALGIGTPRRMRDPDHLRAVRKLPCLICERAPCHAHHVKFAQRPGLSIKVSDEFAVPLCSVHHDELHRSATERKWWESHGIDPLLVADKLWQERREHGQQSQTL